MDKKSRLKSLVGGDQMEQREKVLLFELSGLKKKLKDAEAHYKKQFYASRVVDEAQVKLLYLEYAAYIVQEIDAIMDELEELHND
jgi:hypothetical protein